jgi:hypothetical protein
LVLCGIRVQEDGNIFTNGWSFSINRYINNPASVFLKQHANFEKQTSRRKKTILKEMVNRLR